MLTCPNTHTLHTYVQTSENMWRKCNNVSVCYSLHCVCLCINLAWRTNIQIGHNTAVHWMAILDIHFNKHFCNLLSNSRHRNEYTLVLDGNCSVWMCVQHLGICAKCTFRKEHNCRAWNVFWANVPFAIFGIIHIIVIYVQFGYNLKSTTNTNRWMHNLRFDQTIGCSIPQICRV